MARAPADRDPRPDPVMPPNENTGTARFLGTRNTDHLFSWEAQVARDRARIRHWIAKGLV